MLEEATGSTEDSLKAAVTSLEKAKEANKKIQDQGTAFMEKFAITPTEISWQEDLKHKLERGLFCPTVSLDWHQVPDLTDMLQHHLPAMRALQNGHNPWAANPKLLEEMPDLKHTVATAASGEASTPGADGPAVTGPGMATLNEMDEEAKWALKDPPKSDMVEPFHYTDQEVEAHCQEGTRPPLGSILSIWWAHDTDKDERWRWESRTWDLKSLIHIYSHRYTFKYIYSFRGKDAPPSATKTRNIRRSEARKEASSFLAALGLDKPADKDEWRTVLREMGSFLATNCKVFLTNCPAPVMEMPVAPVHDSKEAMRFRAICDERITIPLDALKQFPEVHSKLVATKEKGATKGGYMCRYCQGFWKASRGGTLASLQLVMDEPPEALYNKWIKERMEFYKRVEPCAAPRDERLEPVGKMNHRLRFSTSNDLGAVSDAIWQVILSNEEMKGIRAIQQVAQKVTAAA
ncbi:unnamed protein product [Durusdinium trenchii]|uniref:Uncharacterized protein n=1 Tax=Durusdinium trenchii TaxID=1381693 RepID=A0ABP0T0G0_9DINO